ncbi:hypothetical protein Tco_0231020 [Tanacetum coccineum]
MAGVDVNTLTMEQYLALSRENQAPGVVKPEIGGNVNFEIKSQFMRELREDTFFRNKDEDAHSHIDRVLSIVSLFNILGVSKDAVMLRVFPFTLTGAVKRWVDRLALGTINTWDLLKKAFIQRLDAKFAKDLTSTRIRTSALDAKWDILIDYDSPIVVGRGFLRTIGAIVNTPERLFSTFDGFYHQTFRAARSDFMRNAKSDSDDEEEYQIKRNKLWEQTMTRPDHHDPNAQDMKSWKRYYFHKFTTSSYYEEDVAEMQSLEIDDMLRIRLRKAASNEEIFTSFDEVCADDELQTKKIIKFILGGHTHSLTLLEFAQRLGLYQAVELEEDGFNVYFEGGLGNDDNFNAEDYWLSIGREDNLGLSRSHTSIIKNPILRVIHKMITYGLCQRMTGYDKGLDTTTLRDLIDSDGKLIPEDMNASSPTN